MSSEPVSVGAILLAAGSSSRLGQPKQLLPWQGRSLLRNAAEAAVASGASPVIVVLGSRADEIAPQIDGLPVHSIVNSDWEQGMGSSLQAGMRRLGKTADPDAVLVLLCDQPLVTPEYLKTVIATYREQPQKSVASHYQDGMLGPPCLFIRDLFPALTKLSGAQGARAVISKLPAEELSLVPFPEGLADVDTQEDWQRLTGDRVRESSNDEQ